MKKLLIVCCMAGAMAMPMALTSVLRAEVPSISIDVRVPERGDDLHEALRALEKAKHHLKEAKHDFGGHREVALIACENAIFQLKLAREAEGH